jgi:tRNA-splicing ligase RtcB (3'-phosphate/5'-hydroxy nucleic acid ligase)
LPTSAAGELHVAKRQRDERPIVEVIERAALPVWSWARDLEAGAREQALNCAALPVTFHHVAVMADGHQGYGVPIGAVIALRDALSPYAVGNDIGCGMAIVPTTVTRGDILGPVMTRSGSHGPIARDDIMGWVQTTVPSGNDTHRRPITGSPVDPLLVSAFNAMEEAATVSGIALSTSQSPRQDDKAPPLTREDFLHRGKMQLGTLGSGNHFIELLAGPEDDTWLMLHSGSRGVGGAICNNFHRMATAYCAEQGYDLPDSGLAWLPTDDDGTWGRVAACYAEALNAGLAYAEHNRRHMLEAVASIVERRFPDSLRWDGMINIHHNDATLESHYGDSVWVHRKGAVKASARTATITPGSMGSATWIGEGKGAPESFSSCSHGAGRTRSRSRARAELSLQRELETVAAAGGKVFAANKEAVLDEMPGAYKDLDEVMTAQADLVRPVRKLTPLATYKGAESRRRRRDRARTWRPEEER